MVGDKELSVASARGSNFFRWDNAARVACFWLIKRPKLTIKISLTIPGVERAIAFSPKLVERMPQAVIIKRI